jgi:hypothetical protein
VQAVQKPRLANPSPPRDVDHKTATIVIRPVFEIAPKRAQKFSSADEFILLTASENILQTRNPVVTHDFLLGKRDFQNTTH